MLLKDKEDTQDKQDTCKKEATRAVQNQTGDTGQRDQQEIQDEK